MPGVVLSVLCDKEQKSCQPYADFAIDAAEPYLKLCGVPYLRKGAGKDKGEAYRALKLYLSYTEAKEERIRILAAEGLSRQLADILAENYKDIAGGRRVAFGPAPQNDCVALAFEGDFLPGNIETAGAALALSLSEYCGRSFIPVETLQPVPAFNYVYLGPVYGLVSTMENGLNLRDGPDKSCEIYFSMPKGSRMMVLSGAVNGWMRVRCGVTEGYSFAKYISVYAIPPLPDCAKYGVAMTQCGGLNIRDRPSINGDILSRAKSGDGMIVTGSKVNNYYPVLYDGVEGFASSFYLKV